MRFNRIYPKCPECKKTISFLQGLEMWNPWKVSCPACKAALEMSWVSKVATVLSVPVGLAWAGVAIYMEETKQWATQDSFVYFAITLPIFIAIGYILWPKTKLYAKHKNA
jgi:hypothetical protein